MATTYAVPDGRVAMAATTYSGNSSTQNISNAVNGISFQPDWVWWKRRDTAAGNGLADSVRGANKSLSSNSTAAEITTTDGFVGFNSNGFALNGPGISNYDTNYTGGTYVGWQWKAGAGSTSSNTSGSITSTVSVNATAGFSVVSWTATAANATVGHGLGVAPSFIITKNRSRAGYNWITYHSSLGNTQAVFLDLTNAAGTSANYWNNTSPTSSVFTTGIGFNLNGDSYIAYCFAQVAGYSKFGSYTGNGSTDGPFVYCGFRPRFILAKQSDAIRGWSIEDTARSTYNAMILELEAQSSAAESSNAAWSVDALSNGFKIRTTDTEFNASGGTYIFAAFAENPFKFANAR